MSKRKVPLKRSMEAKALSSIIFHPRIKPNGKVYHRKGSHFHDY